VDEFAAGNAELYKKENLEAIYAFADLVTLEFGAISLKNKNYWAPKE
jgi:hypothetical protein